MIKKKIHNTFMTLILNTIQLILTNNILNALCLISVSFFYKKKSYRILLILFYISIILDKTRLIVPGLQNILSIVHPSIVLFFYGMIINYIFNKNHIILNKIYVILLSVLITLFLGGLWAFQEFT